MFDQRLHHDRGQRRVVERCGGLLAVRQGPFHEVDELLTLLAVGLPAIHQQPGERRDRISVLPRRTSHRHPPAAVPPPAPPPPPRPSPACPERSLAALTG